MKIKYEVLQIKWLVILAALLFWCWRQRIQFQRYIAEYEPELVYNAWDVILDQVMHPFPMLWLVLPIWLMLTQRAVMELGELTVWIRVRNDLTWLVLLLRKLSLPLGMVLVLWMLAVGSTSIALRFEAGWSEFAMNAQIFNTFTATFVQEDWSPLLAIFAQLLLLALFLCMLTLVIGVTWMYTEKSWVISLLAAGIMVGSIIAYHKQANFPEWQWMTITNWLLLLNAHSTFGAFGYAFLGSPIIALVCVGLAWIRRSRKGFAAMSRVKRRLFQ